MSDDLIDALSPPFNAETILTRRRALRRVLLERAQPLGSKVAILGGSTTNDFKDVLELFLLRLGVRPTFYVSEYNRYYEDAVFAESPLRAFKPEFALIYTTHRNIATLPDVAAGREEADRTIRAEANRFVGMWDALYQGGGCTVIQNNFDLPPYRTLGNFEAVAPGGRVRTIERLNAHLADAALERSFVHINDLNYLAAQFGLAQWHDVRRWYAYKHAFSVDALPSVAFSISRIFASVLGLTKKCLTLDLDNTLWGGVVGDDGKEGIRIGPESPVGEAHSALQEYAALLRRRGVILAVSSKNEPANALSAFERPEMTLKREDFAAFKANWLPKHENLKKIAGELDIGVDSLVFVDDNPAERALVGAQLPSVATPDVGAVVERFVEILDRQAYFETTSISAEDTKRADFYAKNALRAEQESQFATYDDYLLSLDMRADIGRFVPPFMERIVQLINKTNQFNLTTKRMTFPEAEEYRTAADRLGLYGRLVDKFGDNGLVSIVAGRFEEDVFFVDLWLMSCRVLKRDLELAMFDELVEICRARGVRSIHGEYRPTPKNGLVASLYADLGFAPVGRDELGSSRWRFELPAAFERRNKVIRVEAGER